MKNSVLLLFTPLLLSSLLLSSCSAIGGIFKAGMGFGIFVVIAALVIMVGIVAKKRVK